MADRRKTERLKKAAKKKREQARLHSLQKKLQDAIRLGRDGRHASAIPIFRELVSELNDNLAMRLNLAKCLALSNEIDETRLIVDKVLSSPDATVENFLQAAQLLEESYLFESALHVWRLLTVRSAKSDIPWVQVARLSERLNRIEEANEALERVSESGQKSHSYLLTKAQVKIRCGNGQIALEDFRVVAQSPDATIEQRRSALAGMIWLLDNQGDFKGAWELAIERHELCADKARRLLDNVPRITETPNESLKREAEVHNDQAPVLLTGFPRSGTTLTGRILASLPGVDYLDEIGCLEQLLIRWKTESIVQLYSLQHEYWAMVKQRIGNAADQSKILVDKNPAMCGALGSVQGIFPRLKTVFCRRQAADVFVSCFLSDLPLNAFTASFGIPDEFLSHYRQVEDAASRFRENAQDSWIEVDYEDLVGDGGGSLICKWNQLIQTNHPLPEETRVRQLSRGTIVNSPSYKDVVKPIDSSRVDRWKHYYEFAPDVFDELLK